MSEILIKSLEKLEHKKRIFLIAGVSPDNIQIKLIDNQIEKLQSQIAFAAKIDELAKRTNDKS